MSSLLVKNLRAVVTCDDEDRVLHNVDLYCIDGFLRQIGPGLNREADEIIDGSFLLCYPGLVNTHHHLYQCFSRNLPQVQRMELFDWLRTLYGIWKNLDEDTVYYAALTALGEMVKYGCTTCFDHHYVFPQSAGDLLGAEFRAGRELGIRMVCSRGSMDLSEKDGGLPPDSVVQSIDDILRDCETAVSRYHDPSPGSMTQVALAPCSPFSVSADLLRESAVLARSLGVRLHTHLCETKDEERYMLEREGVRPLGYMEKLGWLGKDVWFAHGIHFHDAELDLLAQTGTGVAHCPASNMKLSSGVCRLPDLLERNIPVGLALDGSASNDGNSLLEEMRVAYLLHRLQDSRRAPTGYDLLKIATRGGAKVLGREDIGSLEAGKCADFFLVDSRRLELVGALEDERNVLATVGLRGPVDYTVVNGRVAVRQGRLTGWDEEELSSKAGNACRRYLSK
jgi:cytosine/adenosine deaminase-related metal-dependent hydrolase